MGRIPWAVLGEALAHDMPSAEDFPNHHLDAEPLGVGLVSVICGYQGFGSHRYGE
jgi:hypothetical protein